MKRFDMFMEMQKKKLKFEETKIAIKAEAEARKLLFVKPTDFDPSAVKFVQEYRDTMYKRFARKECEKEAEN